MVLSPPRHPPQPTPLCNCPRRQPGNSSHPRRNLSDPYHPATTVNGTIAIPLAPAVIQHAIPLITNPHRSRLDHEQQQPSAKTQDNAPRPSSINRTTSEWSPPQRYPQSWIARIPHRPSSLQTTTPLYSAQISCVPTTQLTPYSTWNSKSATQRRSKPRKPSTPPPRQ